MLNAEGIEEMCTLKIKTFCIGWDILSGLWVTMGEDHQ